MERNSFGVRLLFLIGTGSDKSGRKAVQYGTLLGNTARITSGFSFSVDRCGGDSRLCERFALARAGESRPYVNWNFPRLDPVLQGL